MQEKENRPSISPLLKRIKRHVIGKTRDFFAATAPGVEYLCLDELLSLAKVSDSNQQFSVQDAKAIPGGVEFKGRLQDCYLANLHLRTANRILMRISEFKATNFMQLEKRLADFPWELFLPPISVNTLDSSQNEVGSSQRLEPTMVGYEPTMFDSEPTTDRICQISVTCRHSRLYHKEAVADRFHASISARLTHMAIPLPTLVDSSLKVESTGSSQRLEPTLAIPVPNSLVDSSLKVESTGSSQRLEPTLARLEPTTPHLFIRAEDDHFTVSIDSSGELLYKRGIKTYGSSAPIRETIGSTVLKLAGYDGKMPLIDPMCGSGTFSLEGGMIGANIPPGWFRHFAFMDWLSFKPQQWAYIKREAEKRFVRPENSPLIFASDKEKRFCEHLEKRVKESGLDDMIQVSCEDFFNFSPTKLTDKTGLVVINPPYGRRIGTTQESSTLIHAICDHLKKEYKGWKVALILPEKSLVKALPFHLTSHIIHHGGLKLNLVLFFA